MSASVLGHARVSVSSVRELTAKRCFINFRLFLVADIGFLCVWLFIVAFPGRKLQRTCTRFRCVGLELHTYYLFLEQLFSM